MKILAIDTSSISASVAILEDDLLVGEFFTNTKATHSLTVMPMVENLLLQCNCSIEEIDVFAVNVGPGSFTGLRIGISAVKGMAYALDKPCVGVSTLESLAYNLPYVNGVVCPVMDARCDQVYTATFYPNKEKLERLTQDTPLSIACLEENLKTEKKDVFLVGDGANLCYNKLEKLGNIRIAPNHLRFSRASSVALVAYYKFLKEGAINADALSPEYLRLPQAQRELLAKQEKAIT